MAVAVTALADGITDKVVQTFRDDGAVPLRGVIEQSWLDLIAEGIEKTLANPTPYARVQSRPDDPGRFFTDYYLWRHYSEFERFAREGPGGEIAARLTGSSTVHYFYEGLFVKEPGTARASDWHQDQPYYNVDGRRLCILWIPLDPVSAETALRFVRGSHAWGRWFQPVFFASERVLKGAADRYEPVPDIEAEPGRYEVLAWDLEPGDCVAFHPSTLHGARGNRTTRRRRAISTTWLGDDAVYGERQGEVEPEIEGHDFRPGDRLDVESVFPKVWPRG